MTAAPQILIVDDKPANLVALASVLKPLPVTLVKATSGDQALALTLEQDFALAILDVQMPQMDGYELAQLMRGDQRTKNIPIIFLSAIYSDELHQFKGYQSGAVDFITKPFNPEVLLSKIRIFLELHQRAQEAAQINLRLEELLAAQEQVNQELSREIAARQQIEKSLHQAKDAAEAANKAKSEFLANMSHEIRTPLNGVLGMLRLLMGEASPEERAQFTDLAYQAGKSLLALLNDILDFTRMEAGQLRLAHEPFGLRHLFKDVQYAFSLASQEKGLAMSFQVDPSVPELFAGDEPRIRQVLFNLVGNAIKFTPSGSVRTDAWSRPSRRHPNKARLYICVSDTGIGIPDEQQSFVFERFTQAEAPHLRPHQGAGLGLAIVRRIVESMGGGIDVDSEVGVGTTVCLHLLLDTAQQARPDSAATKKDPLLPSQRPLRILIAEDEAIGRLSMQLMLKHMGHTVVTANTGQQALDALRQNDFDCIFMDIQMPHMDGLEATRIIRSSPEFAKKSKVRIIALTAYAMSGDRERFLAAGMDDHVPKPVQPETIQAALTAVV